MKRLDAQEREKLLNLDPVRVFMRAHGQIQEALMMLLDDEVVASVEKLLSVRDGLDRIVLAHYEDAELDS